jgi:hypothetical protein
MASSSKPASLNVGSRFFDRGHREPDLHRAAAGLVVDDVIFERRQSERRDLEVLALFRVRVADEQRHGLQHEDRILRHGLISRYFEGERARLRVGNSATAEDGVSVSTTDAVSDAIVASSAGRCGRDITVASRKTGASSNRMST